MTENPDSNATVEESKPRRTSREPKPYSKHESTKGLKKSPVRACKRSSTELKESDESDDSSEMNLSDSSSSTL